MFSNLRQKSAGSVCAVAAALLFAAPSAGALMIDFTGTTDTAFPVKSFVDSGSGVELLVTAGSSPVTAFDALVTVQLSGLGVRSQPFVMNDGDGPLDSDGSDESLLFTFLDSGGNARNVILDTIVFSFFAPGVDDVSLAVNGGTLVGPNFPLPAATWELSGLPAGAPTGNNFALSTTGLDTDDDLRVASISFRLVPEPGAMGLLALGLGLVSWRRLASADRQRRHL